MSLIQPFQPTDCVAKSPSDSAVFTPGQVYVGYVGTATIVSYNGTTAAFYCPAGTILPVLAKMILSTGTTATGFVIMY